MKNYSNIDAQNEILNRVILPITKKSYQLGFMPSAYILKLVKLNDKGQFLTLPFYEVKKLTAINYDINTSDFKIFTRANYKLPKKIDVLRLANIINDGKVLGYDVEKFTEIFMLHNNVQWTIEVKNNVINGDVEKTYNILKNALLFDLVAKDGKLTGVRFSNREKCNTIENCLIECGINPREYKGFISDLIQFANNATLARYTVKRINDSEEIEKIYARKHDDFNSCMRGFKAPARIYQNYAMKDGKPLQSVALHVLECEGEFVARFLVRLKSNKYATVYSNLDSDMTENILSNFGFERNCSCMVGARLPLKTNDNNAIYMPYFDGDTKEIRLINDDNLGQFLQIGGLNGEEIGLASGTNGYAKINNTGIDLGFRYSNNSDNNSEGDYICECCNCSVDSEGVYNSPNGDVLCEECYYDNYSNCEECEEITDRENITYMPNVYIARTGRTIEMSVCQCCISDFWQSPTDDTYFYLNDIS